MTVTEFVRKVEGYYGPYPGERRGVVALYLQQRGYRPKFLDRLWRALIYQVEATYRYVPDVACLDKLADKLAEEPPEAAPAGTLQIEDGAEDRKEDVAQCFATMRQKLGMKPWRGGK